MQNQQQSHSSDTADLQREVAALMIECLNLEVTVDEIAPDEPLYGEGLGLDSIDVLEIAMAVSKRYDIELRADGKEELHVFSSLRSLTDYIAARRAC